MGWLPTKQTSNDVSWKKVNTKLHLNMNGKVIPEDEQVKFLGAIIDNNLHFDSNIKEICGEVNQKTSALSRWRGYISEKEANTVLLSNFQYRPLIRLFCSKVADNLVIE